MRIIAERRPRCHRAHPRPRADESQPDRAGARRARGKEADLRPAPVRDRRADAARSRRPQDDPAIEFPPHGIVGLEGYGITLVEQRPIPIVDRAEACLKVRNSFEASDVSTVCVQLRSAAKGWARKDRRWSGVRDRGRADAGVGPLLLTLARKRLELDAPFSRRADPRPDRGRSSPLRRASAGPSGPLWITRPHDIAFVISTWSRRWGSRDAGDGLLAGWLDRGGDGDEGRRASSPSWCWSILWASRSAARPTATSQDIWLLHPDKVAALKWHDPEKGKRDFPSDAGREARHHRPQHGDVCPLLLGALHAQSQAQAPAAPHQGADAGRSGARTTAS